MIIASRTLSAELPFWFRNQTPSNNIRVNCLPKSESFDPCKDSDYWQFDMVLNGNQRKQSITR